MSNSDNSPVKLNLDQQIKDTQAKVDEVIDIVKENVMIKLNERTSKLTDLEQIAGTLEHGSLQFQKQSVKLKREYWWKNIKVIAIIGLLCGIILLIIVILLIIQLFG